MIGDKPRDLEAGQRAGIPVNLLIGDQPSPEIEPTARIQNLHQALAWL
jgi:phosphoglycolate phosphatase-like HAD superfamily hydrolase